jgi:hypothetical protein
MCNLFPNNGLRQFLKKIKKARSIRSGKDTSMGKEIVAVLSSP